jgi:hypothetical protein
MSLLDMVVALHVSMVVQYLLLVTEFVTCSEYFVDFSTFFSFLSFLSVVCGIQPPHTLNILHPLQMGGLNPRP